MHTAAATFPHVGVGHGVPTHDSKSVVVNHGGSLKTICNALGVTLIGNEEETILHLFKGRPDEPEVLVVRFVTLDELSERDIPVSGFAFASICQQHPEEFLKGPLGALMDSHRCFWTIQQSRTIPAQLVEVVCKYRQTFNRLKRHYGRDPRTEEMAKEMNLTYRKTSMIESINKDILPLAHTIHYTATPVLNKVRFVVR